MLQRLAAISAVAKVPNHIRDFLFVHVVGFALAGIPAADGGTGGDIRWDSGSEPRWKRPKEEDFLENNNINANSQISSVDFMQTRSVSTGLGLSLDDRRIISSGESPAFPLVDDAIERELQRQDAEMDRNPKKVQANQLQTLSFAEERILQKLQEKEAGVEDINKKNMELEERMKQLSVEAGKAKKVAVIVMWMIRPLAAMISGQWKYLPVVAALTSERDGEIRKTALNTLATAYESLGLERYLDLEAILNQGEAKRGKFRALIEELQSKVETFITAGKEVLLKKLDPTSRWVSMRYLSPLGRN
ncbi:hypothetical protein Syun_018734 [Stephania yunnanensis]|uniref:TOG domain-containing protein n=1 Tax=Stephania yunnanensis TaxID=152371 RepID=A0AAP0NVA8_9MAGN